MPVQPGGLDHLPGDYRNIPEKAKRAAAGTTNVLNELISRNAISTGTSMLVTSTNTALQIYVWEIRNSSGLARNYACHQLELYLMVLAQLGKTYWTADLQHNVYVEALKVLNSGSSTVERDPADPMLHTRHGQAVDLASTGTPDVNHTEGSYLQGTLEDYLLSFNPFMGMPMEGDGMTYVHPSATVGTTDRVCTALP